MKHRKKAVIGELARVRARAEAAEKRAAQILESVTDGVVSVDREWRFTYLNPAAQRVIQAGTGETELLGRLIWEAIPGLLGTRFEREYRRAVERQEPAHFEDCFASFDQWFEVHAYPSSEGLSIYFRDVTERKRAEERLRTLESVVTQANDAVLITEPAPLDEPGPKIVYANEGFTRMSGYRLEEVVGRNPRMMQGPGTDRAATARIRAALERREPVRVELLNYKKDGAPFSVEISITPVFDERGELKHFTSVQRDTTERRRAEETSLRLAREEAAHAEAESARRRITAILESITDAFFAVDREWRFTYVNRRIEEIFSRSREELIGKQLWQEIPTAWDSPFGREFRRAMAEQTPRAFEACSTFTGRWFQVHAYPSADALSVYLHDVTDRRRAELELRASERLLSAVFEILPVGLWLTDREGRFVRANPAGQRMWCAAARPDTAWERSAQEAWWADDGALIDPGDRPLWRALKKGEATIGKMIRVACGDHVRRVIITSAMPLWDEQGAFAGAIVADEDVTALKESEEALRRAVRARDEVLGIVVHDLRNPLSVMILHLQLLRRRTAEAPREVQEAIEAIQRQATRMNRLIQDLLDVARIEAGSLSIQPACVAVDRLIAEVCEAQRSIAAAASLELQVELRGQPPEVWADRDRLAQVLENLIGNAVKFTPQGGRVCVGAAAQGEQILFWVSDTGAGVSAEHLPHLFDRFWQASRSDKRGAGLGLAIVKGIVEAHGGRVWAESRVGQGTTFRFTLPRAEAAIGRHEKAS